MDIEINNKDNINVLNNAQYNFKERKLQIDTEIEKEKEERENAKKSKYSRWSQYNLDHTKEMILLASKYPKSHAILLFLIDNADNYNSVMCSYQIFQDLLNISKDTVRLAIKVLKEKNLIHVYKSGTSNVYCVNPDLYWKSWGDKVSYCKFPTNVIISFDEQDTDYKIKYENLKNITNVK